MPIILQESDRNFGKTVLWSVTESLDFFQSALEKSSLRTGHVVNWHPRRQLEWFSGRYLIHEFMGIPLGDLRVDQNGKPCFENSDFHISISHTKGIVGLQFHERSIGLDIQITTDKVHRVAPKFCSDNDYHLLAPYFEQKKIEMITWGFKEAVFKAYGKGQVSYKDQIILEKVRLKGIHPRLHISLRKEDVQLHFEGRIRIFGPYYMVQVYLQEDSENPI